MKSENLFPARLLGFGFYWAWLFLVGVSPSPVLGVVEFKGVPFEILELGFRLLAIVGIVVFSRQLSSDAGRKLLLALCFIVGPISTLSFLVVGEGAVIASATLVACADAAIFMLWLCFFGHMRVGETALYMALSYASGALLCLVIMNLGGEIALVCSALLPMLSGCAFMLSNRFYVKETGEPAMFSREEDEIQESETVFPYLHRIAWALGLYALLFGLFTSVAVSNQLGGSFVGPYIEAPCCLVLGVLLAIVFRSPRHTHKLYLIYRFIPLLFAAALVVLLLASGTAFFVASACAMLGYLAFEITALNDFCNAVKTRGLSLVRVLGTARFAITAGMLAGWVLGYASSFLPDGLSPLHFAVAVSALVVTVTSTLVFTEKEVFAVQGVADERILQEHPVQPTDFTESLEEFGKRWGMSKREMEVLDLLLKGRNTQYISSHLFIAPGTTKTHIYNIYRKVGIHTKMELLDLFDTFCLERTFT